MPPSGNGNRGNGNPFKRNSSNDPNGNQKGNNSGGPQPFWKSPWLWGVLLVVMAVAGFQLFAGAGTQTIDTKDGMQILNGNTVEYATIVDNTQQVKLSYVFDGRELFQTKDIKALTLAFDNETIEFVKSVVGRENLNIIWRSRLV